MNKLQFESMCADHQSRARGSGKWRRAQCGWCELRGFGFDHRGNWCLNVETGYFHCFRCQKRGFLPGCEPGDEAFEEREEPKPEPGALEAPEGFVPLTTPDDDDVRRARRYLMRRGITPQIAKAAGIGVCTSGDFAGRIIVPVFEADGVTWGGWSGRLYMPNSREPKYRYPAGMPRYRTLYNAHALSVKTHVPCLCVEGVFDALPYWPHCTAFLGKPSPGQLEVLFDAKRPLVICLDGDAWSEAEMLAEKFRFLEFPHPVGWVRLPPRADPNTVDPGWLRAQADRAVSEFAAGIVSDGH